MKKTLGLEAGPSGPRGHWLVGNLQAYEEDRLGFLTTMRDQHGGLAAFDRHTTVVSDPVLADIVLRDCSGTFEVSQNFLGCPVSPSQVEAVRGLRPLLNPGLRPAAVASLDSHVRSSTTVAFGACGLGRPFDPTQPAEQVFSEVVARHFFGEQGAALVPHVASLLDALEKVIGNVFAMPAAWPSPAQMIIRRRYACLQALVVKMVLSRRKDGPQDGVRGDVATQVVRNGDAFSIDQLSDLLIGSLLAAQRVPAAAAGWLLMLVADHGPVQASIRAESAELFRPRPGTELLAERFPFAVATVLETMRMYPPTWLLSRAATRPARLGGHTFPAGHTFFVSPYVLHRDPALFVEPHRFKPEHWLGTVPPPTTYLPFGRGRHRCPGADLSISLLVTMLLTLLHEHEITRVGGVEPDPRTSLRPGGLRVLLRRTAPTLESTEGQVGVTATPVGASTLTTSGARSACPQLLG